MKNFPTAIRSAFPGLLLAGGLMLLASPFTANAKPAIKTPVTVTQPDGTELSVLLRGDARCHFAYTLDGFLLVDDPALGYVYADITPEGELLSSGILAENVEKRSIAAKSLLNKITPEMTEMAVAKRTEAALRSKEALATRGVGRFTSSYPVKGEQKAIVILVEFQDVKFGDKNGVANSYAEYGDGTAHGYWTDMLNKEGFDGFGGTGSCRDFFLQNSRDENGNSQFSPEFDLYGPVTLPENMSYYGSNDFYGNDRYPHMMVSQACEILDPDVDFSQYDRDGDGYVDNIYFFYAGFGEADGGGKNTVWPHSWNLAAAHMAPEFDGVIVDSYGCSNETDHSYLRPDGIGTFVHEFSHVMGLPDLYATAGYAYTPGEYSTLDYGPYNNEGRTPPAYSAYERYALDWMVPEEIGEEGEYYLDPLMDTNKAIIVKTEKENEFYLAESRPQTGWDEFIPGHGMLIWHVDYVKSVFDGNRVNNNSSHQYVDLIEANGRTNASAASGHPFPGTANVTSYEFKAWSKKYTGVTFSNITEDPETGRISFHAVNDNYVVDVVENIASTEEEVEWFNLQGMPVANPVKGQLLIRHTPSGSKKVIY